jgi:uncharacterized damage-inducible protein DinB
MTTDQAEFLRDFLLDQLEREYGNTRKLLAAIPETASTHRPHPESMSTLELARHLVEAELVLLECIAAGTLDHMREADGVPESLPKLVAHYETRFPAAIAGVRALRPRSLVEPMPFYGGPRPRVTHLAYVLKHSIHHRGQLSTLLRALGAFVPGMFGRSLDERKAA